MTWKNPEKTQDPTIMGNDQPRRDPVGHEGAGAHQEGKFSRDADRGDRGVKAGAESDDAEIERSGPQAGRRKSAGSDDQATHGPDDRHGEDRDTL